MATAIFLMIRPTLRVVSRPPRQLISNADECFLAFRQHLLAGRQVGRERDLYRVAKGYVALLLSLAADEDRLIAQADVLEIDPDQLGVPDAAAVEQLEHQPVALGKGRDFRHLSVEHAIHFLDRRNSRKFFGQLRGRDQGRRILLDHSLLRQPAIERAHRRQRARHRSLAQSLFVEMRQKSADGDVVDLLPSPRADVSGEFCQIAAVGLDGVDRGIALAQRLQEMRDGFLDDGLRCRHDLIPSARRHRAGCRRWASRPPATRCLRGATNISYLAFALG